jgi:hypothetical protein
MELRRKILTVWKGLEEGKITPAHARIQIGLARTVLDSLKVEIAAAHVSQSPVQPVRFDPNGEPHSLPHPNGAN